MPEAPYEYGLATRVVAVVEVEADRIPLRSPHRRPLAADLPPGKTLGEPLDPVEHCPHRVVDEGRRPALRPPSRSVVDLLRGPREDDDGNGGPHPARRAA